MLGGTRLEDCSRQGNKWEVEGLKHFLALLLVDAVLRGAATSVQRFSSIKRT